MYLSYAHNIVVVFNTWSESQSIDKLLLSFVYYRALVGTHYLKILKFSHTSQLDNNPGRLITRDLTLLQNLSPYIAHPRTCVGSMWSESEPMDVMWSRSHAVQLSPPESSLVCGVLVIVVSSSPQNPPPPWINFAQDAPPENLHDTQEL